MATCACVHASVRMRARLFVQRADPERARRAHQPRARGTAPKPATCQSSCGSVLESLRFFSVVMVVEGFTDLPGRYTLIDLLAARLLALALLSHEVRMFDSSAARPSVRRWSSRIVEVACLY